MRIKIMDKKTNFPDLERLPPHNHLKHFLEWLINKPKMIIEDYVKKNFPDKNLELEILKLNLELKEYELTLLKKEIQELRNILIFHKN
tara:strand:+ start:564 stop:827 length:264 start_codon:yes stop_codon:yes gene_type:complete